MKKITAAALSGIIQAISVLVEKSGMSWKSVIVCFAFCGTGIVVSKMFFEYKRNPVKESNCQACEKEKTMLMGYLDTWMKQLANETEDTVQQKSTSYYSDITKRDFISFASLEDTLPQNKPIIKQMDSLIKKLRQDSINRTKQKSMISFLNLKK